MTLKSTRNIHVCTIDTDEARLMRPASFLQYAQDIAGDNADLLGFGYDEMIKDNLAWIISRVKVRFLRHPQWREDVSLVSWNRGPDGPFYIRDYEMYDSEGRKIVESTSSWIVLELSERKIVRTALAENPQTICPEQTIEGPEGTCSRLRLPRGLGMTPAGIHKVSYSDLDKNGHTNNVMYVVWAMDALPLELVNRNPVKELEINYSREALAGETVELSTARSEDGAWWVEGRVDGLQSFVVRLTF